MILHISVDRHPVLLPFFKTAWVSRHQKGKTILDFNNETRDDEVAVASAGLYANHLHLSDANE